MIDMAVLLPVKGPRRIPLGPVLATGDGDFCLELVSDPLSLSLGNDSSYSPRSHSPYSRDEYFDVVTFIVVIFFIA